MSSRRHGIVERIEPATVAPELKAEIQQLAVLIQAGRIGILCDHFVERRAGVAEQEELIAPVHIRAALLALGANRREVIALERLEDQFVWRETSRHVERVRRNQAFSSTPAASFSRVTSSCS